MNFKLCFNIENFENQKPPFEVCFINKFNNPPYEIEKLDYLDIFDTLKGRIEYHFAEHFLYRKMLNKKHEIEQQYLKLNPEISRQEYVAKNWFKHLYSVFKALQSAQEPMKCYAKVKEIASYKISGVLFESARVRLSFDVVKDEDGALYIKPQFINEETSQLIESAEPIEFLIKSGLTFYVLNEKEYRTLQLLESKKAIQYRHSPDLLSHHVLEDLEKNYQVDRHDYFNEIEIETEPKNAILLSESGGFLLIHPKWDYDGVKVEGKYQENYATYRNGVKYIIKRDQEKEQSFLDQIKGQYKEFEKQLNGYFFINEDNAKKKNWFLQFYHHLLQQDIEVLGLDMLKNFRYSKFPIEYAIQWLSNTDYGVEVAFKIQFGEEIISNRELQKTLLARQRHIMLSDHTIGVLPDEWLAKFSLMIKHAKINDHSILIPKWLLVFQKDLLDQTSIGHSIVEEDWGSQWNMWQQSDGVLYPISNEIKATLRPYQQKGFEWMVLLSKIGAGACLADDMGLGKTLQTICFLDYRRLMPNKSIIVCPASLIYNWKQEILKFAPHLTVEIFHSANRNFEQVASVNPDIIITSYGTLRLDIDLFNALKWNTVVLDESHMIKNPNAQVTKAVLTLASDMKVILSGTPIMNNTFDLFAQFSFILPNFFNSREFFEKEYSNPIDKDKDSEKIEQLKRVTNPFILRRTKEQVAKDLPPKIESILWCEMGEAQSRLYHEIKNQVSKSLFLQVKNEGLAKSKMSVLAAIQKLRQVCSSPVSLTDFEYRTSESIKIDLLIEELKGNLKNNKVIVFSQYLSSLDEVKNRLKVEKIQFYSIDGSTKSERRIEQINEFQDPENEIKVFLLSLKAGNAGITLTAANYVFLIDPWWNRQVEQQAIDRTYRIGQNQNVFAYRMICKDSIEERIISLQQNKLALSEELVTEDEGFVKNLSESDLDFLFS